SWLSMASSIWASVGAPPREPPVGLTSTPVVSDDVSVPVVSDDVSVPVVSDDISAPPVLDGMGVTGGVGPGPEGAQALTLTASTALATARRLERRVQSLVARTATFKV